MLISQYIHIIPCSTDESLQVKMITKDIVAKKNRIIIGKKYLLHPYEIICLQIIVIASELCYLIRKLLKSWLLNVLVENHC